MDFNLFNHLITPIFVVNTSKDIIYSNQSFINFLNISHARIKRKSQISNWISFENDNSITCANIPINDLNINKECAYQTYDGQKGIFNVISIPLNTENTQWITFLNDMTLEITLQSKYQQQLQKKENLIQELKEAEKKLKIYSNHLEDLVDERTKELKELNNFLNAMIESINQGLFVFDAAGNISPLYTKVCDDFFNTNLKSKKLWDLLVNNSYDEETIKIWVKNIFKNKSFQDDILKLGPSDFINKNDRYIELKYYPMISNNKNEGIVSLATDKTDEIKAKKEIEFQKNYSKMIIAITQNKFLLKKLAEDIGEIFNSTNIIIKENDSKDVINNLLAMLHSIKGMISFYYAQDLVQKCHKLEDYCKNLQTDEIDKNQLLSKMNNLKSDFNIFFQQCDQILGKDSTNENFSLDMPYTTFQNFYEELKKNNNPKLLKQFKEYFVKTPISYFFVGINDYLQQLSSTLDKELNDIYWEGENIRVDLSKFSDLFSSFIHIFKNMIDHGIEAKNERLEKGKDQKGQIKILINQIKKNNRAYLQIKISDDGKGLDLDLIKQRIKNKETISDNNIENYIFTPSFSTKDHTDTISGRGIGLSTVKDQVNKLQGSIEVESKDSKGTTFIIQVSI